jgi:hypothetical protein
VKISMRVTVEIDPNDWIAAFGVEGQSEIRDDVKQYIRSLLQGDGVFGSGEVPADVTVR